MAMYRVAMNQLMKITSRENLFQPCFANDGNCTGSIEDLKQLHDATVADEAKKTRKGIITKTFRT